MCTGKSAIGRRLAQSCGWPCFDLDEMIVSALQRPITQIFAELGEERFRDEEARVLKNLDDSKPSIIIAGGGAVLRAENRERLRKLGTVVCLTADLATLRQRLSAGADRPLLRGGDLGERIEALLRERKPFYDQTADLTIDTSALSPDEVAESIAKILARRD